MKAAGSSNADASANLAPALPAGDLAATLSGLTQDGRRAVRDMLDLIAHRMAGQPATTHSMRRRLDAVIAGLIAVADAIDGECD